MADEKNVRVALILSAYDRMSRVVNESMNKSIGHLNRFKKAADRIGGSGTGSAMGGVITAAAAYEFGKNAVEMAEKYESMAISIKQSMTNAAGQVAPAYDKIIALSGRLAESYKGGKVEIMGMMNSLINTGMNASVITEKFSKSVLDYGRVMGIPYDEAATIIGRTIKMGKIAQGDMAALPDLFSRMKILGVTNAEDIAQAVGRSGMGVMGMGGIKNMQAMAAIIVKIQQATGGAAGAGAAMQVIMSKLADPAKMTKFNEQLHKSGISMQFYDKKGKFLGLENMVAQLGQVPANLRQQVFGQMFGRRGGVAAASLSDLGIKGYNETLGKMMSQQSLMNKSEERGRLVTEKLQIAMSALKGIMIDFGMKLMPMIARMAEVATRAAISFKNWYKENQVLGQTLKYLVIGLASLKIATMAYNFVVIGTIKNVGRFAGGVAKSLLNIRDLKDTIHFYILEMKQAAIYEKMAAASQWIFNTSLYGCPIVWIIAGVMAVVVAVIVMIKYWDKIKERLVFLTPVIKVFKNLWVQLKGSISSLAMAIQPILGMIGRLFNLFKPLFSTAFKTVAIAGFVLIAGAITLIGGAIWVVVKGLTILIKTFTRVINFVTSVGSIFFRAGSNIVKSIFNGIQSMASKPIEAMRNIVQKIRNFLPFSPAKEGPLSTLHRVRIVETIAQTMKATPITRAMKSITGEVAGQSYKFNGGSQSGAGLVYAPVVNIYGSATGKDKDDFMAMLKSHEAEVMRLIQSNQARNERKKY